MSRTSIAFSTTPSAPASVGPKSSRYMIVGQTQTGPIDTASVVTSLAEYAAVYGARSGGTSMYDAAELAFRCGVSELVVARAFGPSALKATISLDTGKIVVTAKSVGAYANGWTAQWAISGTTLTITAGTVVETYVGATSAALVAAAASSQIVTVTSSGTLPVGNVGPTALAGGTDDFATVSWANSLALLTPDLGAGAVAVPEVAYGTVGQLLATHCAANLRHGMVTAAAGTTVANLVTAVATIKAYTSSEFLDLVGPWVKASDGAGGTKTVDPTPFAAGLRSAAIREKSPGHSAVSEQFAKRVNGVTPEYPVGEADWATLTAARISAIRTVGGYTRLYTYTMVAAPGGNLNLIGGQYRDLFNAVAFDAGVILESAVGSPASDAIFKQLEGYLSAMLAPYSPTYLKPQIGVDGYALHPGYRVQVSTGTAPADNRVQAVLSLRASESIDFVDLIVAVGDATFSL